MNHPTLLCCITLALCALLPARAERADRLQAMQIEADSLQHDEARQITLIQGRVTATKGSIVMRGERMEVRQDTEGRQNALLTSKAGERVFFRQKREGLDEFIEGEAERADYNGAKDIITLSGRAELRVLRGTQAINRVEGQVIVFNNSTETYTVDGRNDAGSARVRATISPRGAASQPAPAPTIAPAPGLRSSSRLTP